MSTSSGNPSLSSQNVFKFLEPYHRKSSIHRRAHGYCNQLLCTVVICAALALSSPVGWGWPVSSLSEFWFHGFLLTGLALIGFIAPTTKFAGPLRFGYLESNILVSTFFQHLPSLSPYAVLVFVFLPSSRYWTMCALPVGWQYVLQNYRENVQEIRNKVDDARSRATVAASSAQEYAKEAAEYEKQAMEVIAVKRRDAVVAESVRITDFFDTAARSWAAWGRIVDAANNASNAATETRAQAEAYRGTHASDLPQKARDVETAAQNAEQKAEITQATVSESVTAREHADAARDQALENGRRAAEAADSLKDRRADPSATFRAVGGAENVKRFAEQAMAAVVEGDKKTALSLAEKANDAAEEVVKAKDELFLAKERVREIFFELV